MRLKPCKQMLQEKWRQLTLAVLVTGANRPPPQKKKTQQNNNNKKTNNQQQTNKINMKLDEVIDEKRKWIAEV